jgi:hypothetical protein
MKKEMLILCLLNIGSLFSIIKPSKYLEADQLHLGNVDVWSSRIESSQLSQAKKQKYHNQIADIHKINKTGQASVLSDIPADGLAKRLEKVEKDFKKASSLGSKIKSTLSVKLGGAKTTLQSGFKSIKQTIKNGIVTLKNKAQMPIKNAGYGKQSEYKGTAEDGVNISSYSGSEKHEELTLKINSLSDEAKKNALQLQHDQFKNIFNPKPSDIRQLKKLEQQVNEASPYVYVKDEKLEVQNKKNVAIKNREQEVLKEHEALRRMMYDEGEQQLPARAAVAESFAAIKVPENKKIAPGLNMQKIDALQKKLAVDCYQKKNNNNLKKILMRLFQTYKILLYSKFGLLKLKVILKIRLILRCGLKILRTH